jgi:hypothetical protein
MGWTRDDYLYILESSFLTTVASLPPYYSILLLPRYLYASGTTNIYVNAAAVLAAVNA